MGIVIYETETPSFTFEFDDITQFLNQSKNRTEELDDLLEFLSSSTDDPIKIPEKCDYFSSIAMDLVNEGKASVFCMPCGTLIFKKDHFKG